MAAITIHFGKGGVNLQPGHGDPSLATAMRDVADDFTGLQVADIVSADATDLAEALTLVNEIKGALNVVAPSGHTLLTTKA